MASLDMADVDDDHKKPKARIQDDYLSDEEGDGILQEDNGVVIMKNESAKASAIEIINEVEEDEEETAKGNSVMQRDSTSGDRREMPSFQNPYEVHRMSHQVDRSSPV